MYEIEKNSKEVIRVDRTTFKGILLVDMRVWFQDESGVWHATKKGLTVTPATFRDLVEILSAHVDDLAPQKQEKTYNKEWTHATS